MRPRPCRSPQAHGRDRGRGWPRPLRTRRPPAAPVASACAVPQARPRVAAPARPAARRSSAPRRAPSPALRHRMRPSRRARRACASSSTATRAPRRAGRSGRPRRSRRGRTAAALPTAARGPPAHQALRGGPPRRPRSRRQPSPPRRARRPPPPCLQPVAARAAAAAQRPGMARKRAQRSRAWRAQWATAVRSRICRAPAPLPLREAATRGARAAASKRRGAAPGAH